MVFEDELTHLVVFRLDRQRYALPLAAVEHVLRAAAITPLPAAPSIVLGAVDVHGQVLAVLNVRRRFLLPDREVTPDDCFLLARAARRTVALLIDEAEGVIERSRADIVPASEMVPGLVHFPGVARLDDGLVLIQDLDRFLSQDEADALDTALREDPEA